MKPAAKRLPILIALASLPAIGHPAPPRGTILTLSVTGDAASPPDRTVATLSTRQQAPTAAAAQLATNRAMKTALADAGAIKGMSATTGSYSVFPTDPNQHIWQAQQTLVLTLTAAPGTPAARPMRRLIGDLQAKGMLLDDIAGTLSTDAARRTRARAIADAVRQMQAEAKETADALGLHVDQVTAVQLATQAPFRPMIMAARIAGASPQAQPGPIDQRITLSATIRLGPA